MSVWWKARIKAVALALWIHSILFWGYISARIVSTVAQPADYFIDAFPSFLGIELTFLNLGIMSFLAGLFFFIIYALLKESLSDEPKWEEMLYWHELGVLEEDPIYRALEDDKPPKGVA